MNKQVHPSPPSPGAKGTYAVILLLDHACVVRVGGLGLIAFDQGFYAYVGSAFGPGGLAARTLRHLMRPQRLRWHIDYLKGHAIPMGLWISETGQNREHQWASAMGKMSGAVPGPRGFGSSDCRCRTHLFRFRTAPSWKSFTRVLDAVIPGHARVVSCRVQP